MRWEDRKFPRDFSLDINTQPSSKVSSAAAHNTSKRRFCRSFYVRFSHLALTTVGGRGGGRPPKMIYDSKRETLSTSLVVRKLEVRKVKEKKNVCAGLFS